MHATTESIDACPLPNVDGRGLTRAEVDRITRARNWAKADHGARYPDAPAREWEQAGRAAAAAEFRQLLADRTAAVMAALPSCCSPTEAAACQGCQHHAGELEADASTWPAWCDSDVWALGPAPDFEPTPADVAWWAENCPAATSTPRSPAAALGLIPAATAERLVGLSLIGRHQDLDLY